MMGNFEIRTGINFEHILAIKSKDEEFEIVQIPIKRSTRLFEELREIYMDPTQNAADMYDQVRLSIRNIGELPFCLNHEYHNSYISDIAYPDFNSWEYRHEIESLYQSKLKSRTRYLNKSSENYQEEYSQCEKKVKEIIGNKVYKDKTDYLKRCIPYIYAFDYHNTLEECNIQEDYYLYSNEIHGRFTYCHDLNEDFKIKVKTNFCFGSASYFNLIITYKGIDILPYSAWVKYYYAGYNELMRFTRSYYSHRDSWSYCMNFLKNYVNSAILNPEEFIHKDIMEEINGLMEGLEHIFTMNEDSFKELLKVKHINEDDNRYIGISAGRHAISSDVERYKIRPQECAMIFKMEKICGALHFLESLHKLQEIDIEINRVINRIKELNRSIYPDVLNAMPPIESEIKYHADKLYPLNRKLTAKKKRLDKLERILDSRLSKVQSHEKREAIQESFIKYHPEYKEAEERVTELTHEIWDIESKIKDRKSVLDRLNEFKELIDSNAR